MSDHEPNLNETGSEETGTEPSPAYTPASFEKRVAAWVGVVYMVMLVLSVTYMIATAKVLTGTAFLLLPPAAVGVAIVAIHRQRTGRSKVNEGKYFTFALVFLCFIAFAMGLVCGIPNLLANFGVTLAGFTVIAP